MITSIVGNILAVNYDTSLNIDYVLEELIGNLLIKRQFNEYGN